MTAKASFVLKWWTLLASAALVLVGCTRTVMGGYTDSPDKKFRIYGRVYGQYGRSFLEQGPKQVRISIVAGPISDETLLLRREYRVQGFDVGWAADWDEHNNLTVVVHDYGRGIDRWDAKKNGSPTNHLLTLVYRLDPKTRKFVEASPKS
jgi:hypothetical protein